MNKFKIGDRVQLKHQATYTGAWPGPMEVTLVQHDGYLYCEHPVRGGGCFYPAELEAVAEEVCNPVTYRIYTSGVIGNTEYTSMAEALEVAQKHGTDGEQFSIFEVIKIADYRVKVTKELEEL